MAMVDTLAAKLSEITGSKFTVHRKREELTKFTTVRGHGGLQQIKYSKPRLRYVLSVGRSITFGDDKSSQFQAMDISTGFYTGVYMGERQMRATLAMLCDLVQMGYVPVEKAQ